jgi:hypothetical protein
MDSITLEREVEISYIAVCYGTMADNFVMDGTTTHRFLSRS